jgi:hypothetical protein
LIEADENWRVVEASTGPAFGATTFATGSVHTFNGGPLQWNETIPGSGTSISLSSARHTMSATAQANSVGFGAWGLSAMGNATAAFLYPGALASAGADLTINDRITPTVDCSFGCPFYEEGDNILYRVPFYVSGSVTGTASGEGNFSNSDAVYTVSVVGTEVAYGEESFNTIEGYVSTMPRGQVPTLEVSLQPDVPVDVRIQLQVGVLAFTAGDSGQANATSQFIQTFRWGEVTDVFNARTGEPIPAEFFHLNGEDGFDWAHPPAVPEPSTVGLLASLALFISRRRRSSIPVLNWATFRLGSNDEIVAAVC